MGLAAVRRTRSKTVKRGRGNKIKKRGNSTVLWIGSQNLEVTKHYATPGGNEGTWEDEPRRAASKTH